MKIIIEVGSTTTKIDKVENGEIKRLEECIIWFKRNYAKQNKLEEADIEKLIEKVQKLKEITENIYICGTSIFRVLPEEEKQSFLNYFMQKTNLTFHIISQEKENLLTVLGASKYANEKVCVFVGGGGSTEISICENGNIIESADSPIGVIDVLQKFPDLSENYATSSLQEVTTFMQGKLNLPKNKANILILAGGGHQYFVLNSGFHYTSNTLYQDAREPIMMDIQTRKEDSENYFTKASLDTIKNKTVDPNWWFATRAMVAEVLLVAEQIGADYIIPTDISMVYALVEEE